jgi:hypothetical protein
MFGDLGISKTYYGHFSDNGQPGGIVSDWQGKSHQRLGQNAKTS